MKIAIVNHYASAGGGGGTRHLDLGRELVRLGHEVRIVSTSYSHATLRQVHLSGRRWMHVTSCQGVTFVWIKTRSYKRNDWRRLFNIMGFTARLWILGRRALGTPDVIIGSTPHPFAAFAACHAARMARRPFVYEVRDVWPESLVDLSGISERGVIARIINSVHQLLLARSALVISLLDVYAERIRLLCPQQRVAYIPNGVAPERLESSVVRSVPHEHQQKMRQLREDAKLIAVFSGSLKMRNVRVILQAASLLQESGDTRVHFVLLGGGVDRPAVVRAAEELSLRNIDILPPVPRDAVVPMLREADVGIFSLAAAPVFGLGVSSNKIFDYLAAALPIVFATEAASKLAERSGAGICILAEDSRALVDALKRLGEMRAEGRRKMGMSGLEYARAHHVWPVLAKRLEHELVTLVEDRKSDRWRSSEGDT